MVPTWVWLLCALAGVHKGRLFQVVIRGALLRSTSSGRWWVISGKTHQLAWLEVHFAGFHCHEYEILKYPNLASHTGEHWREEKSDWCSPEHGNSNLDRGNTRSYHSLEPAKQQPTCQESRKYFSYFSTCFSSQLSATHHSHHPRRANRVESVCLRLAFLGPAWACFE